MESSLQYSILKDLQIILIYFYGIVSIDQFIEHYKTVTQDPDYNAEFNTITDFRDADFSFNRRDIIRFAELVKTSPHTVANRRISLLSDKPKQTALSLLYILNTKDLPFTVNVNSTLTSAVIWALLPGNKTEFISGQFAKMKKASSAV